MVGVAAASSDLTPTVHLEAANRRSEAEMVYVAHFHAQP